MSINTGQILRGSVHTFQNYWTEAIGKENKTIASGSVAAKTSNGRQEVRIKVSNNGYQSNVIEKYTKESIACSIAESAPERKGCRKIKCLVIIFSRNRSSFV